MQKRCLMGLMVAFLSLWVAIAPPVKAQSFTLELEEMPFPDMPGLHSGAFTKFEGKWVFIGGRINGLHGFLPPLAFPEYGENNDIWVVDYATQEVWSAPVDSLPDEIREPITSTNMEFYREDSTLYMIGGYGWQDTLGNFITFPTLTAIDLPGLIQAVMDTTPLLPHFRYLNDPRMAVCGAHVGKIGNQYQLVWGHQFDGYYDESDTSGFFVQTYTREIRRFEIQDNGASLSIQNYAAERDSLNFRRRDYNLVPQIFPNGDFGYTGFTGVFREDLDLPHLTVVDIHSASYEHHTGFNQNLSQYHSAVMPLFDSQSKDMETVFFGGMSLYKLDGAGSLVLDSLVPFVNTISKVVRDSLGNLTEYALPDTLPGLLGTNQYFLPSDSVELLQEDILDLAQINGRTLAGYLIGGIDSPEENISTTDPSLSIASNKVFKVYVNHTPITTGNEVPVVQPVLVEAFPNPFQEKVQFQLTVNSPQPLTLRILDLEGRIVKKLYAGPATPDLVVEWEASDHPAGVYFYEAAAGQYKTVGRIVRE